METIKKHKWFIHSSALAVLVVAFILCAALFEHKTWLPNVLQALGTIIGMYLTLIIFLHSKEGADKQFKKQLEHLQALNHKQIEALQALTEKQIINQQELNSSQIETLKQTTDLQLRTLQDLNTKQIVALQELTEKQIEALHKTTFDQISAFERQHREVTSKLSDNSILLAEILGRELEKSIDLFDSAIKREEAKYNDLSGFKLLRTQQEKERQLTNQWNKIQRIKEGYEYLLNKYNQIRSYLGFGQKKLNG